MDIQLTPEEMKFIEFVSMLSSTAVYQMGKMANPMSGKVEKDLKAAKMTIDLLLLLKEKTKGNLTHNEQKILVESLSFLQLNYVEEIKEEEKQSKETKEPAPSAKKEEVVSEKKQETTDEKLNWEKHERKSYGPSTEKK